MDKGNGWKGNDCKPLCNLPMATLKEMPKATAAERMTFCHGGQSWTICPHPHYGMPGPPDMEVYMLLLQLSAERGKARNVTFNANEFLTRMRWGTGSARYARLRLALQRWQETTYVQEGVICFEGRTDVRQDRFKVLQQVSVTTQARAPWSVTWSDILHQLIVEAEVRLDPDLYLRLSRPIAQAAYRQLSAWVWYPHKRYPVTLMDWACHRLGIKERYLSKVKQNLLPALDELIEVGFLDRYEIADHLIFFYRAPPPVKAAQKPVVGPQPVDRPLPPRVVSPADNERELAAMLAQEDNPVLRQYLARRQPKNKSEEMP